MTYKQVLLTDDDAEDQEIFASVLRSMSPEYTCTTLNDAEEALFKLEEKQITADLIFLDICMPVMSGLEFLQELQTKEKLREIPIIVYSDVTDLSLIRQTKDLGALDYMIKPNTYSQLKKNLSAVLLAKPTY